jgi:hypothetical protein
MAIFNSYVSLPEGKYVESWRVGGFNPSENFEFVSWEDYSQYMKKIKAMFQTTNQFFVNIH